MRRMTTILILIAGISAVVSYAEAAQLCPIVSGASLSRLKERLNGSGLIVVLRHAATDDVRSPGDCLQPERHLSGEGRRQAQDIHAAFVHFGLNKWKSYHSPACRTVETAELVLAPVSSEIMDQLYDGSPSLLAEQLMKLAKTIPAGKHVLLITHSTKIAGIEVRGENLAIRSPEDFGIAVVFDPSLKPSASTSEDWFLGCLWPKDWSELWAKPKEVSAPHSVR